MRLHRWLMSVMLGMAPILLAEPADDAQRTWTDVRGRQVIGEVVACDHHWFTIRNAEGVKGVIRIDELTAPDREFLKTWRAENPGAPWVDPDKIAPWPESAGAGPVEARLENSDPERHQFTYRSEHFELISDIELPLSAVGDIASTFEATRDAVRAVPLGLGGQPPPSRQGNYVFGNYPKMQHDPDKLLVLLFETPAAYARAGGPGGTGGSYTSWQNRLLISLENLGIKRDGDELVLDHMKSDFVLRHEMTHQIMHHWLSRLPMWLREGIAEYFAAAGYAEGRYNFAEMDQRMHKYANKWRFNEDPDEIPLLHPRLLMTMSEAQWQAALSRETPIVNYNSAGLLTHFFIHHDGEKNAAHFAAYFDAIRRGVSHAEAERAHLLRGRTHDELAQQLRKTWQAKNVSLVFEGEEPNF